MMMVLSDASSDSNRGSAGSLHPGPVPVMPLHRDATPGMIRTATGWLTSKGYLQEGGYIQLPATLHNAAAATPKGYIV